MVTLVLSDVVGDPLEVIASGPTVGDPSTLAQCADVIDSYRIDVPEVLRCALRAAVRPGKSSGCPHKRWLGSGRTLAAAMLCT